jgi:hypothetical protein
MAEPRDQDDVPTGEPGFTPVDKLAELSPRQKKEVREKSRPNAALIHETIRSEGIGELEREPWALALSALAAGLSMGFSMVVKGKLETVLPPGPARALISPLGYTVGFLIVVLGRQQPDGQAGPDSRPQEFPHYPGRQARSLSRPMRRILRAGTRPYGDPGVCPAANGL